MSLSLVELLEDVLDNVEDAVDTLAVADGPLADPDKALVAEYINTAETRIELALDHINNAGDLDPLEAIKDLQDVADECVALAQQALHETGSSDCSVSVIGNKLKTLKHLIHAPGGYKDLAGL